MTKRDTIDEFLALPTDYDIITGQFDRFARAYDGHKEWAESAKLCQEFVEGQQWTDAEKRILEMEGRPIITKNKIAPLVRFLLGMQRQNRYDIKVMPSNDSLSSYDTAELITALIKQIEEAEQADWKNSQVFQDGIITGRGFWDIRVDFNKNMQGNIAITADDPFSTYIDPEGESYDPNATNGWGFVTSSRWASLEQILITYGTKGFKAIEDMQTHSGVAAQDYYSYGLDADITPPRFFGLEEAFSWDYSFAGSLYASPFYHVNRSRKLIRLMDTQHRLLQQVYYAVDMETGEEEILPEGIKREQIQALIAYANSMGYHIDVRKGLRHKIRWTVTAGNRVLHDEWSPYKLYTKVPYFPYFRRGKTRGMVEDIIDPQRELNKRHSALLHVIMATANAGWMYEENSMREDMQRALEEEGSRPGIHIEYRKGAQQPSRIEPAATPQALLGLEEMYSFDLKEISGINDSSLGQLDRVQSGRAIQARQKQAIVGSEVYFDNFARSRELCGRLQLAHIQAFYTEERMVRVRKGRLGVQDQQEAINVMTAANEIKNNVSLGVYDVEVDEAPASSTFMQAQFQEAMELRESGVPIPDDTLIELSSMPNKQDILQKIKEERLRQEELMKLEATGMKMQMGIDPSIPAPPVVTQPPLVAPPAPQPQEQAMMPGPIPPQGV